MVMEGPRINSTCANAMKKWGRPVTWDIVNNTKSCNYCGSMTVQEFQVQLETLHKDFFEINHERKQISIRRNHAPFRFCHYHLLDDEAGQESANAVWDIILEKLDAKS
jgi:hypothetical protein